MCMFVLTVVGLSPSWSYSGGCPRNLKDPNHRLYLPILLPFLQLIMVLFPHVMFPCTIIMNTNLCAIISTYLSYVSIPPESKIQHWPENQLRL